MIALLIDSLAALPAAVWLCAVISQSRRERRVANFAWATLAAVVISGILAHVNRWLFLWKSHPNFPSGHETFAACVGTALVALDRRYLPLSLAICVVLGYALVRAGWHGRLEVAGGFILGIAVAAGALQVNGIDPRTK